MSFYNWIQEKLFDEYEEWCLKSPGSNGNGFNIVGIDNTLQAMHDGFYMYMEVYPPHAIDGCTAMKARVGKTPDAVDIFLDIDGKTYRMADVRYPDAVKMMRAFMKKRRVPDCSLCVEAVYLDIDQMRSTFTELATLLLGCKCELEDFIYYVQKLICNKSLDTRENLTIDTAALNEDQVIMDWCASLNSTWENYTLVGMDTGTDSFVLMVLSNEEFKIAQELAKELLHRIDVAERL